MEKRKEQEKEERKVARGPRDRSGENYRGGRPRLLTNGAACGERGEAREKIRRGPRGS